MSADKLQGIQAARAIVALGVVLFHSSFVIRSVPEEYRFDAAPLFDFGFNGVFLFFVISGFIIAKVIDDSRFELRGFAIKRFVRIYPLYWAIVGIAVVSEAFGITYAQQPASTGYLAATLAIAPLPPPIVPFYSLGWTLEHEIVFYAIAAVAGALGGVRALFATILVLGLAGAVAQIGESGGRWTAPWTWHVVDYHNLYFAAGVGFYLVRGRLRRLGIVMPLLLAAAGAWVSIALRYSGPMSFQFAAAVGGMALGAVFLCAALLNADDAKLPAPLRHPYRALIAIGNWSYSLYLVHYLLMRPAELAALRYGLAENAPWAAEPIRWALVIATIGVAGLVYRWAEEPLIRHGHALAKRFGRQSTTEPLAVATGTPVERS